ncbi:MAG: 4-hydroxythreonine-4-phosphate dehydrogenase PdxA [Bacteroidales bacterium]|nr:4-hydroxythreonine-4-phosphate dehydrogenase PdxA [Bacteroidales bacterium]
MTEKKIVLGITHGDFNGISYEIILKMLRDPRIIEIFTPVLYGSSKIVSYYRKALDMGEISFQNIRRAEHANPKKLNIINCFEEEVKIETGKLASRAGELAFLSLEMATKDLLSGQIDVMVTAPINKKNIQSDRFDFPGHTEYLAQQARTEDYLMMMVGEKIRIGFVTGHVPVNKLVITKALVARKIATLNQSLINDFNILKPKIAVLGVNPHAGDNGLIGEEETQQIIPAIENAKNSGMLVFGPYSADGFFGSGNYTKFDGILAMYHDQGMIPFKLISFDEGANYTAGLPFVRTSPAHGTAFDIAGKNLASPDSIANAAYLAIDIFKNRELNKQIRENPLRFGKPQPVSGNDQLDIEGDEDVSELYDNDQV